MQNSTNNNIFENGFGAKLRSIANTIKDFRFLIKQIRGISKRAKS